MPAADAALFAAGEFVGLKNNDIWSQRMIDVKMIPPNKPSRS
jgi:hypothetical protein